MRITLTSLLALSASPVFAASGPFISLNNTNFVVLLAFLLFIGLLVYLKVPGTISGMLDERAKGIQSELDEARSLREEAQSILAEYERKQKEVQTQADQIVSAQSAAVKEVKDAAVSIAIAAAKDVIASEMKASDANNLIDTAIKDAGDKLH